MESNAVIRLGNSSRIQTGETALRLAGKFDMSYKTE